MAAQLNGKKVAIVATDGFEQAELMEPKKALEQAGAEVQVMAPKDGSIRGWNHTDWGDSVQVDIKVGQARPEDYDALVLPGGVINPDHLRIDEGAMRFIKSFVQSGKVVAAICHGPWTLIEAGAVSGKRMTSWPSLKTDLKNAGSEWVDEEVVVDGRLITSRKPDDLLAFNHAVIEALAGSHAGARASS